MKRFIPFMKADPVVAVVRLAGSIGSGPRSPLSDEVIGPVLERAFRRGKPRAVALVLNSPGGSPVQSALIAARIRRLAADKKIHVHAFVEDVAASGGYWLAAAADDIWADTGSIVGSIGVISAGFGAHVALARQGVERRVYTSAESKSMLDPRGAKLADDPELFTGRFWLGAQAHELGLIDGIGHLEPKLKELYGDKVKLVRYGRRRSLFQRFGATFAQDALAGIEERAAFARFGL
ncbi:MAG: S49 family peptidase [Rhodobacterales bacterium 34-62-10]|nr:MAG: S49 family peptidase [Rhodobacterales bacterium 34-62-10]